MIRRILAGAALLLGAMAPFAGSPSSMKEVSALELATWIKDHKPGLRIVDTRSEEEFEDYHIPGAVHEAAIKKPQIVIYAGSDVFVLRGGMDAWMSDVMNPITSSDVTRYFGGTARRYGGFVRRRGC